jgi:hypothetical protein
MTTRDSGKAKDLTGDGVSEKAPGRSMCYTALPRPSPERMHRPLAESGAPRNSINQQAQDSDTGQYRSPVRTARAQRLRAARP